MAHPQSTQTAVKDIGGTIEMNCSVFNASRFPVAWLKFEKEDPTKTVVLSIGNNLIVRDSRFSLGVFIGTESSSRTFKITNIHNNDVALYRCVVMCDDVDGDTNTSADVQLEVNRSPVILKLSSSSTIMIAREGLPSRLECYADGFPEPRVSWSRQYNGILTTGGQFYRGNVLHFRNVTKDDRGIYLCDAVNSVGEGVRHIVDFRVEFAPVITASKIMYTHSDPLKQDMDVQCLVEAYPAPKIDWLYNGVILIGDNNKRFRIMEKTTEHQLTFSSLNFNEIDYDRYGKYTCKARNTIGTAEVTVIETPCQKPKCDTKRIRPEHIPNFYGLPFE
ncbi:lachesin-like [Rhopalosiphum maidis]|uniref:lachesin-like n=1 Tax=Rhopalosiphum maidis TaxID=43146 RepID=UPI000EFDCDA0|nr:lachesin-like [Rhopalosiphum maidis]